MKYIGSALAVLGLLGTAEAYCPNACSGHGDCGQHDMCSCYVGFIGGDCSLRSCPYHWAWVVTNAPGDINGDGDVNDVTIYDPDHYFKNSGLSHVRDQANPQGTWESWPSFGNVASKDEGHYYMECANRGLCDRETGECACFDGYEGSGCRRMSCPNDCSGHGKCKSVNQLKGSYAYTLWDKDMGRSCVCDAGYSGPDCSERKCPYGDDPLTTGQVNEVQWVDVYTDIDTSAWSDRTFAGHISLTYTDHQGQAWVTDDIAVVPYTTSATDMASKVADALKALPNDVITDVTVTQGYAERVVPGNVKIASSNFAEASNAKTTFALSGGLFRCPETDADKDKIAYTSNGAEMKDESNGDLTFTDVDDTTCYQVEHRWSVRFKISFTATPGDLTALSVDVSKVTISGKTNAQRGDSLAQGQVLSDKELMSHHATGGGTIKYDYPAQLTSCTGTGGANCAIVGSTKTATVDSTASYVLNSRVTITCDGTLLGTFTVDTIPSGTTFTVTEAIPDCTIASPSVLVVTQTSWILTTNADLTGLLAAGDLIKADTFASVTPKISSVQYTASSGVGHIFLESVYTGDNSNSETITTAGTDKIYQAGDGTTEKTECSDRGLCDRENGLCVCFKGYTGEACSTQNALSA